MPGQRTPEQARESYRRYYRRHRDTILARQKIARTTPESRARQSKDNKKYKAKILETRRYLNLIIDRLEHEQLTAMAKKQGISRADLVRNYITWGLENDNAADTQTNNSRLY